MTDYVTDYDPPQLEPLIDRYSGEAHSLLRIVAALLFFCLLYTSDAADD